MQITKKKLDRCNFLFLHNTLKIRRPVECQEQECLVLVPEHCKTEEKPTRFFGLFFLQRNIWPFSAVTSVQIHLSSTDSMSVPSFYHAY